MYINIHNKLQFFLLSSLISLLFVGCSSDKSEKFKLISELNGMTMVQKISGDEAKKQIDKLHGKSVTPDENNILFYKGENGEATLYISFYSDLENAYFAYDRMVNLIRDENNVFGHFHQFEIENQQLSMCLGMGQAHYFFQKDKYLYWLSTNYQIAQSTVVDLLNKLKNG